MMSAVTLMTPSTGSSYISFQDVCSLRGQGLNARSVVQDVRQACKKWRQGALGELWQESMELAKVAQKQDKKNRKKKKRKARQRVGREQANEMEEEVDLQQKRNADRATVLVEEGQL